MRSLALILTLALIACRPSGDRADTQESLAEGGVATSGTTRRGGDPVARGAEKATPETLPTNVVVASPEPEQDEAAVANNTSGLEPEEAGNTLQPAPAPTIPAQYRGSWGLVAADCTSTRGDAKGLIRVGERTIRFYESTATLKEGRPSATSSFAGDFGFTGEGMTWEKAMTFVRSGDRLTRTEDDQTFTYTRCS